MLKRLSGIKGTIFVLAALAVALAWSYFEAQAVPADYQRVFLPAATQAIDANGVTRSDNGLRAARETAKTLDEALAGACDQTTLYALTTPAAVSIEGASVDAQLVGIENGYYAMRGFTLYCGRLIYPDELKDAAHVTLIDEQLAVALFKYAEPLGQTVKVNNAEYEIIGVLRASRKVGMQQDYSIYVPYRAIERSEANVTALVYEAKPAPGSGGWSSFESGSKTMGATGTSISLVKERMNASMPQRVLLCILGFALGLMLIKWLTRLTKRLVVDYREQLKIKYASRLVWRMLPKALALIVGYAVCAAMLAALFAYLIQPVYTFPEWVPAVLVEPNDISAAFWNVWQSTASTVELRTAELLRLRFLRELAFWCSLLAGMLAVKACVALTRPRKAKPVDVEEKM